jgi:hypothetical protein
MGANRTGVREHATKRVRLSFSFLTNAGNDPDAIRQERGTYVSSVVASAAGVYTATFARGPLPQQLTSAHVTQHGPDSSPTSGTLPSVGYVPGLAIDTANRQVVIATMVANGAGAPAVGTPEDNTWVSVTLEGPETSSRADAV